MKIWLLSTVAAGVLVAVGLVAFNGGSASAVSGCPDKGGWAPIGVGAVIPGFDQGAIANLDNNGDGTVCFKAPNGFLESHVGDNGNGAEAGSWVIKDNTGPQ
jgi:hypothetical protein